MRENANLPLFSVKEAGYLVHSARHVTGVKIPDESLRVRPLLAVGNCAASMWGGGRELNLLRQGEQKALILLENQIDDETEEATDAHS